MSEYISTDVFTLKAAWLCHGMQQWMPSSLSAVFTPSLPQYTTIHVYMYSNTLFCTSVLLRFRLDWEDIQSQDWGRSTVPSILQSPGRWSCSIRRICPTTNANEPMCMPPAHGAWWQKILAEYTCIARFHHLQRKLAYQHGLSQYTGFR